MLPIYDYNFVFTVGDTGYRIISLTDFESFDSVARRVSIVNADMLERVGNISYGVSENILGLLRKKTRNTHCHTAASLYSVPHCS